MKNFVKHTLAIAICAAALLSSCIKEEAYVTQDVLIDVTLTRAGTSSAQQGDQIEDIMLWAFELNDAGEVINDGKPIGWRQFTPPAETYTSLNIHLPVKKCGAGGATYRLIAVLNRTTFTDANGAQIAFGPDTTYQQLTTGKFVSASLLAETPEEGKPGEPAVMPITHWADVSVAADDVHATACAEVNIPVYRTVAKTQFYMACKSNQLFDVTIKELSLHCGAMPTEGVILSSLAPTALNDQSTTPAWFGSTAPATGSAANYSLFTEGATPKMLTKYHEERPTIADNETAVKYYDLIGSHFIYETSNKSTTDIATTTAPTKDPGYYYKIVYEADGQERTYYTGIPYSILRNHDYQIHALVEGGSGELTFTIEVVDWQQENITMTYENTVTIADNGYISWTQLPEKGGNVVTTDGKVMSGEINLTYEAGATAKCTFALQTPQYGTWHAELRTLSGVTGNIVFVDRQTGNVIGTSTSGDISDENGAPQQAELIIKNVGNNLATGGSTGDNVVELRIYATGVAGVYQIPNLPGVFDANDAPVFAYYKLTQPRN